MTDYTSEHDTHPDFNLSYDDEGVPQRELSDFVVTRGDEKISICSLDDSKSASGHVIARGTVVHQAKSLKIQSAPLIEWCIEYGQTPHLWVRSAAVWYRLAKPAKEYSKTHELARRRFELCSRIFILATTMPPRDCTYKHFVTLLYGPYGKMKGYSEKELLSEKDFILAQIKNLNEPVFKSISFVKELRDKKTTGSLTKKASAAANKKNAQTSSGIISVPSSTNAPYLGRWVPSANLDADGNARLLKRAEKAVNQLYKSKFAWPFRNPVDPTTDGCPDYLTRIRKPMDYGTVKQRLEKGSWYTNALDVAKDIRLVASNCREYNGDQHEFAVWATDLEHKFENLMRGGEEAELAAMNKRAASGKKRRAPDATPAGKTGKKPGPKVARRNSKGSNPDLSPSPGSSVKDDDSTSPKLCARSNNEGCEKPQITGSKYCSDECGLIVAQRRIDELNKAGYSVDEYIRSSLTKALVHSRS